MQRRTRPYEILIRFNPDATAAHQIAIEEFVEDDGTVVVARTLNPEPLDTKDVSTLVGSQLPRVIAERDVAVESLKAAEKTIAGLRAQFAAAGDAIRDITALFPAREESN